MRCGEAAVRRSRYGQGGRDGIVLLGGERPGLGLESEPGTELRAQRQPLTAVRGEP